MKTILLFLSIVLLLVSCLKKQNDKLSEEELNAVALMKDSYQNAKLYNDSLVYARNGVINADSARLHYLDSRYHYYDQRFDSCHHAYQHDLVTADHSHHNNNNSMQMHGQNGGMMGGCQCCANGGHRAGLHNQMSDLRILHSAYHPY